MRQLGKVTPQFQKVMHQFRFERQQAAYVLHFFNNNFLIPAGPIAAEHLITFATARSTKTYAFFLV
jgi:hypothetical protein